MSAILNILDEIDARLRTISVANGDQNTIKKVTRAQTKPFKDGDLPMINYWPTTDIITLIQHGAEEHKLTLTIEVATKTNDIPFTNLAVDLYTGVVAALNRDVSLNRSPSLGGIAQRLSVDSMTPTIGQGQAPWCGVVIVVSVIYNTIAGETNL